MRGSARSRPLRALPAASAGVRVQGQPTPFWIISLFSTAKLSDMRLARVSVLVDVCCVLIFVVIGRASHTQGETIAGIASTSWPFLCGLGAGWAASRAWRRPLAIRPSGIAVWLCTVALGMILRVVSGQGTAFAFIVVALAFLGLFLLGWRLLARFITR